MTKFSDVLAAGVTIRESANDGSDFTNPAADYRRLFLGEDGLLHVKDSSGTVTSPYTGGSSFSGAKVYHSTTQTVTAATETTVTFDSEEFDTDSYHAGGDPTKLTFPTTAKYLVQAHVGLAATPGASYIYLRLNGSTAVIGSEGSATTNTPDLFCSAIVSGVATEYIEVRAFRTTGTTFGATTGAFSSSFSIVRLG